MLETREKFLPIGTVVLLSGGKKLVMILGFCSRANDGDKIYDYSGCIYPEGVISSDQMLLFNHDQITRIYHVGYENDEERNFKNRLKKELSDDKIKNTSL